MKALAIIFILLSSSLSFGHSEGFIKYSYGNHLQGSYLKIYENGSVELTERTCCPLKIKKTLKKEPLSKKQIKRLKELIMYARLGPFVYYRAKVEPKTMFGEIEAREREYDVLIRQREHADQWVTRNESSAGEEILKLLKSFAPKNKWK